MKTKAKKILFVFGTRPEAIKMAPVISALRKEDGFFRVRICVTAQHRKMLDDVLEVFRIKPDYDLHIMEEGQSLEHITEAVISRLSPVLKKEKPDLVLVHGDTSTTFLATLASFYAKIPVGHVEAGLRSYNFDHPFPEEANRRLADVLCRLYFAPTSEAARNLLREGVSEDRIYITGNTVIDALRWAVAQPEDFSDLTLKDFLEHKDSSILILVTAHRRENFGLPLKNICTALKRVADSFSSVKIVYPVHLNPKVQETAKKILSKHPRILLLPPLNYLDFSHLLKHSYMVVTDSGGLQEEAPSLGKPVLVLREVTERPEAVRAKTAKVIGTDERKIVHEISKLVADTSLYEKMATAVNPYGDGKASERIKDSILHFFGCNKKPSHFKT